MNKIKNLDYIFVGVMLCFSTNSHSAIFGPSNYNECIVYAMKGVTSDVAARAIKQSCKDKYSDSPSSIDITKQVMPKIVDAKIGFNKVMNVFDLYVQFYNGSDYVITSTIVSVIFKNAAGNVVTRKYKSLTNSSPMNTVDHYFPANQQFNPTVISWDIESIKGYKY